MKKALFLLSFLAISLGLKAECPPEVQDFTFTDCYGVEYNLFELLDGEQYVLFHFVTNTSTTSQTTTFVNTYHQFGCNGRDLFFMEVLPTKNDSVCRSWAGNCRASDKLHQSRPCIRYRIVSPTRVSSSL